LPTKKKVEFTKRNCIKCREGFGQRQKEVKVGWRMIGCGPQRHNQCY
jgi:hypothetical protein